MKKSAVIALIIAFLLIFSGLGMIIYSLSTMDFNLKSIDFKLRGTETQNIDNSFDSIEISEAFLDVTVQPTDETVARMEYSVISGIEIGYEIIGNVLKINVSDNRVWHDYIGFFWHNDPHITLYIPKGEYESVKINGNSCDVYVGNSLSFKTAEIESTSGDIDFYAAVSERLNLKTVSGDISALNVKNAEITLKSTSGDISLDNSAAISLKAETTSGDLDIVDVICTETMNLYSVSGDIDFSSCDAPSVELKSTSGDIEGTFLSPKNFITETTSGDISVPNTPNVTETCRAATVSGNIKINVKNSSQIQPRD